MRHTAASLAVISFIVVLGLSRIAFSEDFEGGVFSISPNDLQQSFGRPDPLPITRQFGVPRGPGSGIDIRAGVKAILDTMYDTGRVDSGSEFLPSTIALDGTKDARGRGRFHMSGEHTEVGVNLLAADVVGEPTAKATFDFRGNTVRLRTAYGVVGDDTKLIAGQLWTTFGDVQAQPYSILQDGSPAGAIFRRQAQLRFFRRCRHGFNISVAIENPTSDDFVLLDPVNDEPLQRYPDLVTYLSIFPKPWTDGKWGWGRVGFELARRHGGARDGAAVTA